jgi:formylglycine-generating enzyme required for sulfatase activity
MRDDRTKNQWSVNIKAFEMAKYPVTQELFSAVMGHSLSSDVNSKLPVVNVSWMDAIGFCNKLSELLKRDCSYTIDSQNEKVVYIPNSNGIRLPTEAEWQYACQAGSTGIRYGELNDIAWYKDNSSGKPHQVGQKQPNPWGLYDMLGNVWEWCTDIYDESVYGSYRVFRGGGWNDHERSVMATTRRRSHPISFKIDDLGFRIATKKL